MTKHFHLTLWIPMLFGVLFLSYWAVMFFNSYIELEEFILERQVQYAIDSATATMLEYSSIETDYADGDYMLVEPALAMDDFAWCMCYSWNLIPTEENRDSILQHHVRAAEVVAYDGVYAYYNSYSENDGWGFIQTPKIPFFIRNDSFYPDAYYAITMNPEKGYEAHMSGGNFTMERYNYYTQRPGTDTQKLAIAETCTNLLNWALAHSYSLGNSDIKITVPALSEALTSGVNAIESPTMLAIYEGRVRIGNNIPVAEVIGGAAIEDANHALGYTFNGATIYGVTLKGRYYATESWWKKNSSLIPHDQQAVYFESVYDAAAAGYVDLTYLE